MKSKLIGNEIMIAVTIELTPIELTIYKELIKGIRPGRRYGDRVSAMNLRRMLITNTAKTDRLINNLMQKIGFAYKIKKEQIGGYTYYILYEKREA